MGWELGFGLGALALFVVLIYGVVQSRRAGPRAQQLAERGAKALYDHPAESEASPDGPRRKAPPLVWIMAGVLALWLIAIFVMRDGIQDHGSPEQAARTMPFAPSARG